MARNTSRRRSSLTASSFARCSLALLSFECQVYAAYPPAPCCAGQIYMRWRQRQVISGLTLDRLAVKPYGVRHQEVIAKIEAMGGECVRQVGSHRRYRAYYDQGSCYTTVQIHKGKDVPLGTLRAIQKQMEPAVGKGWLL